jgi:molybdopterin molybdotransferase
MISPELAWTRIAAHCSPLATEEVPRQQAFGRVLTTPLQATVNVPAFDVSAMDGFAVGGAIVAGDRLPIRGTAAAGDAPGADLPAGGALRIMTGAPVPKGADRVVPVEQTTVDRQDVVFKAGVDRGAHIRLQGEILRAGHELLPAGIQLTAGAMGLLATHGISEVLVHRRPEVAVLATGDEVVPPETEPRPGQLRDSHTDFLLAAGRSLGLQFTALGISPDQRHELRNRIKCGLDSDVLLICGGVSKGEFDFVEDVLSELGHEILFDAVAIQPGKPLVAARHSTGFVFGLPGNPASVMVGFWLFVRPLLRCLQGLQDGYWHGALIGELSEPLPAAKGRVRFLTAEIRSAGGRLLVTPLVAKGSHDLVAYAHGSALVRIPAHTSTLAAGQTCEILPLADWSVER